MSNLDERLLAGKLREDKRSSFAKAMEDKGEGGEGVDELDTEQSLRQRVSQARQALNLKELAKEKLAAAVTAPAKAGTSRLLQLAWINLPDSFGLTLIWINIHVFLKLVLGEKLFCRLGEEWLPRQVKEAGGLGAETAVKGFGLIEVMVLLILDLIVLAVILGVLALIVMIVDFMQAGIFKKIDMTIGYLTGLGWSGIKALYDLFAPSWF